MNIVKQLFGVDFIYGACGCNKGKIRKNNEDNFFFSGSYLPAQHSGIKTPLSEVFELKKNDAKGKLFAVFDGMGGAQYGELASHDAAEYTADFLSNPDNFNPNDVTQTLIKLCNNINRKVYDAGMNLGASYMGTTIAALYYYNNKVWSCNIGDSRCYRHRDGILEMMSEDHVEELYYNDIIERKKKPGLIQYLGMDPDEIRLEPTVKCSKTQSGDTYLICSDGLTDMVSEPDIARIINDERNIKDITNRLIKTAIDNGGRDNITAIVCQLR